MEDSKTQDIDIINNSNNNNFNDDNVFNQSSKNDTIDMEEEAVGADIKVETVKFPSALKYLYAFEAFERYAYFGIRTIMMLYMIKFYGFSDHLATTINHVFQGIGYFLPVILGGCIADGKLGRYKTHLIFCLVYCIGFIFLILSTTTMIVGHSKSRWALYVGLLFIAFGSGGVKPIIPTMMGDQVEKKDKSRMVDKIYSLFFFIISVAVLATTITAPLIRSSVSYQVAFAMCFSSFFLAIASFMSGSNQFKKRQVTNSVLLTSIGIIGNGISESIKYLVGRPSSLGHINYQGHWLDRTKAKYQENDVESVKLCLNVFTIFIPFIFQRALPELSNTRWILQAESMNRQFGNHLISSDHIQAISCFLFLISIPFCEYLIDRPLKRRGIKFNPLKKMGVGIFISILAYIMCIILQLYIDKRPPYSVSFFLQVPQLFVLSLSEVFISIPALQFAYENSPATHKSVVMSAWLVCISLGNMFIVVVIQLSHLKQWLEYLDFVIITLVFGIIFIILAYRFKPPNSTLTHYKPNQTKNNNNKEKEKEKENENYQVKKDKVVIDQQTQIDMEMEMNTTTIPLYDDQ
ncbi:hypothetical protein DFA_05901 [Cavenderia fasciculata]|uniref:Peptide transporter n=1 Tax=Cavenderia fasciculata TaxID=261658 RepID=F4PJJ2_CACFS|nr:uncharacterized protein DFA_05901 [Cavenderia fasciculata]EGG23766.1 hypothetical protein DFA_05901 [Cavenderia fasciculata]|eukprot:XP_004361617.1 hypothetical protein DFA_05901 [Cavenderia fasciculata]